MARPIHQLALPLETHRNHYLFSDHYLNELLPRQPVWREVETEAQEALEAITALYDQVADALPHYNEAQTEAHWIRPVLDILGHVYGVQPSLPGALGTPDYAFFADQETRQAAAPTLGRAEYWETALAVGDAKRWDRLLDKRIVDGALDAFTNVNPCYQIDYYLRRTGCAWGVISNGRQWRLYHQDSNFRLDVFYEYVAYDDRGVIATTHAWFVLSTVHLATLTTLTRRYFHSLGTERTECERASESYSLLYLCALPNSRTLQHQLDTFRPGHIDAYSDDWKRLSAASPSPPRRRSGSGWWGMG